jgi:hypothetical protein
LIAADLERTGVDGEGRGELPVAAAKLARLRKRLVLGDVERRPVSPRGPTLVLLPAEPEAAAEHERAAERQRDEAELVIRPGRRWIVCLGSKRQIQAPLAPGVQLGVSLREGLCRLVG